MSKPKNIGDLLDNTEKLNFANELLSQFDNLGLAVLSKADFEAYLYYLLKKHKKENLDLNKFDWIRLLKVTPSKLNSMQLLSSVKFENYGDKKDECLTNLIKELSKNKIEIYDKDKDLLQILISDMHLKLFIEEFALQNGYSIKYENNPNQLIIQYSLFLQILDEIETKYDDKIKLRELLIEQLKDCDENLKAAITTKEPFLHFFTKKIFKEADKQLYAESIKLMGNTALQIFLTYIKNH
jgi:hypothetical protein